MFKALASQRRRESIKPKVLQPDNGSRSMNASVGPASLAKVQAGYGDWDVDKSEFPDIESTYNSVREWFLRMERLHREEKDRIVVLMLEEHEDYKRSCEEQFEAFRSENKRLLRVISASASPTTLLEIQLNSPGDGHPGTTSLPDNLVDSNVTTIISRMQEQPFQMREQFLQIERLHREEKDRIVALMSEAHEDYKRSCEKQFEAFQMEIAEAKRENRVKAEQIATAHRDAEQFRRELSSASYRIAELQELYEEQTKELDNVLDELRRIGSLYPEDVTKAKTKACISTIYELQQKYYTESREFSSIRSQLVSSVNWKRPDTTEIKELTARKDLEHLRRYLSTSSSQIIEYQQRCAAQSAQSVELTSQIEQWKRSDAAKAEEYTTVREKLEQLQHDLFTSFSRIIEFQERYEAQSTELSSFREQLQVTSFGGDRALITLNAQIEESRPADAAKVEELTRARRVVKHLQRKLSPSSSQIEELQRYCAEQLDALRKSSFVPESRKVYENITTEHRDKENARQSQLDGVQRFVATANTYTETMIIRMLQKLNTEIQQSSMFMAECIVEDFQSRAAEPTNEQISAVQRVSQSVGQTLAACLWRTERDGVALYLQIAFQAYIVYYLHLFISSWTTEKEYNDLINKTYEQLRRSEGQVISGRWRSLTRTYISPACMGDPQTLISSVVSGLSDIVVAAGCAPSPSTARSKVSSQFGEKASSIISIAGHFSRMIGETVSSDFEVLVVSPLQMFEESRMEEDVDVYEKEQGAEDGTETSQKVLCLTQLGMTKRVELESGKSDALTVVKAKVVLESILDD